MKGKEIQKRIIMKKIELEIKGLKELLSQKEIEVGNNTNAISKVNLIRKGIENLELFYNSRDKNPFLEKEIIKNFTKKIEQIKKDIEDINL